MSLVALQPGCQTCNAFGFGVGTAVEAEAVVLAAVVLVVVALAVVAFDAVATADAALAVDEDAADVVTALDAEVVAAVVVTADVAVEGAVVVADAVVGAAVDWDDVDTVADAPQAARPTAARACTLTVSAVRRETNRWDHREERMLAPHSSGYDNLAGDDDVSIRHSKGNVLSAALYPVCCDLSTDRRASAPQQP
jgi:hypothetical protein